MKKILAILISCMYLAITSGLVLQIHYCMGRQTGSSLKFAETAANTCHTCGMDNGKNKCCHDEVKFLKLQDAHKQVTTDFEVPPPAAAEQEFNLIDPLLHFSSDAPASADHSPPVNDTGKPSIIILNCVFRI